jgi:hypothetical protein
MSEIRERLQAHRKDTLILLQEVTRTAAMHEGFRLAGAVGHLARAQVLLAEELHSLPGGPQPEAASSTGTPPSEDATPVNGVRLTPR